jgi:hypothetical protein
VSVRITANEMTAEPSPHTARTADGRTWEATWLPGRALTRNEAVTAITIAEAVAARDLTVPGDPLRCHVDGWAAELGLIGADAIGRASRTPKPAVIQHAEVTEP